MYSKDDELGLIMALLAAADGRLYPAISKARPQLEAIRSLLEKGKVKARSQGTAGSLSELLRDAEFSKQANLAIARSAIAFTVEQQRRLLAIKNNRDLTEEETNLVTQLGGIIKSLIDLTGEAT